MKSSIKAITVLIIVLLTTGTAGASSYIMNGSSNWQNTSFNNRTISNGSNAIVDGFFAIDWNGSSIGGSDYGTTQPAYSIDSGTLRVNTTNNTNDTGGHYWNTSNYSGNYNFSFDYKNNALGRSFSGQLHWFSNSTTDLGYFRVGDTKFYVYDSPAADALSFGSWKQNTTNYNTYRFVRNGANLKLYENNIEKASLTSTSSTTAIGNLFKIFGFQDDFAGANSYWLDNVRMWSPVSSRSTIHYNDFGTGRQMNGYIVNFTNQTGLTYNSQISIDNVTWYDDVTNVQNGTTYTISNASLKNQTTYLKLISTGDGINTSKLTEVTLIDEASGGGDTFTGTYINSCQNLSVDGGSYKLNTSISSTGTCIIIQASNITLDGAGYNLNYSSSTNGDGIDNTGGYDNLIIKNLHIFQTNASVANVHAIDQTNGINNTYDGNSINTSGSYGIGYYIHDGADNGNFINNSIINTTGTFAYGISLDHANNNSVNNSIITTSGTDVYSVFLTATSENNSFINTNMTTTNSNGVQINSDNNTFENDIVIANGWYQYGYYFDTAANFNSIKNGSTVSIHSTGAEYRIIGANNSFCNNDFTTRKVSIVGTASFNYNQNCSDGIWINTTASGSTIITRTLTNITQSNLTISETLDTARILYYNFTGMAASSKYQIYDGDYVTADINSDVNGNLQDINNSYGTSQESLKILLGTNAPNTTSWSNNATNNDSLSISVAKYADVNFNFTVDQAGTYNWLKDDVVISNNFDNYTTSFNTAGVHTIKGWLNNSDGATLVANWSVDVPVTFNLSACGETISTEGSYTLTQNMSGSGTCFVINANNVSIDGAGYSITYTPIENGDNDMLKQSYAVWNPSYNNTTIKNMVVQQVDSPYHYAHAVFMYQGNNHTIENNTIITGIDTAGGNSLNLAIFLKYSDNNIIRNNTITTTGSGDYCTEIFQGTNNTISNNSCSTYGSDAYAWYFYNGATNNLFQDNIINIHGASHGVSTGTTGGDNNNTFKNETIILDGAFYKYGYLFEANSDNNTVEGGSVSILSEQYGSASYAPISHNNTFKNISFDATTLKKRFYLNDNSSNFNYLNGSIWLNTSNMSYGGSVWNVLCRQITSFTNQEITFIDDMEEPRIVSYNLTGLLPLTTYRIYDDSLITYTESITDSNGNLPDFDISLTTIEKTIRIVNAPIDVLPSAPIITSWGDDFTDNNNLTITVPIYTTVIYSAGANQTITSWNWYNATYLDGNNQANSTANQLYSSLGTDYVNVSGTNANGTTTLKNWTVTVKQKPELRRTVVVS